MGDIGKHIKADMDRMEAEITRLETALAVERARVGAMKKWRDTYVNCGPDGEVGGIIAGTEGTNKLDSLLTAPALAVVRIKAHQLDAKSVETLEMTGIKTRNYPVTAVILAKEGE